MLSQESPTSWPVSWLQNKGFRNSEDHRYHRKLLFSSSAYVGQGFLRVRPLGPWSCLNGLRVSSNGRFRRTIPGPPQLVRVGVQRRGEEGSRVTAKGPLSRCPFATLQVGHVFFLDRGRLWGSN